MTGLRGWGEYIEGKQLYSVRIYYYSKTKKWILVHRKKLWSVLTISTYCPCDQVLLTTGQIWRGGGGEPARSAFTIRRENRKKKMVWILVQEVRQRPFPKTPQQTDGHNKDVLADPGQWLTELKDTVNRSMVALHHHHSTRVKGVPIPHPITPPPLFFFRKRRAFKSQDHGRKLAYRNCVSRTAADPSGLQSNVGCGRDRDDGTAFEKKKIQRKLKEKKMNHAEYLIWKDRLQENVFLKINHLCFIFGFVCPSSFNMHTH